jgi:hypothetical protein
MLYDTPTATIPTNMLEYYVIKVWMWNFLRNNPTMSPVHLLEILTNNNAPIDKPGLAYFYW